MDSLLHAIAERLPCRVMDSNGRPYLMRYRIGKILGLTFYLHHFLASDPGKEVHDHPWAHSLSIILSGGYREEILTGISATGLLMKFKSRSRGSLNLVAGNKFHRISMWNTECWTIFIHGRRTKPWGFLEFTGGESGKASLEYRVAKGRGVYRD